MEQDQADGSRSHKEDSEVAADRRKFMRQLGMAGALAAAVVGATEVTGLSPALAAKHDQKAKPGKSVREIRARQAAGHADANCQYYTICSCTPGQCGRACPSGYWCHHCSGVAGVRKVVLPGHYCVAGGCSDQSFSYIAPC
jgi:hypothetical protein